MSLILALMLALAGQRDLPDDRRCPVMDESFVRARGDACFGAAGRNHFFAFAYPAAAARIPALDALLRAEKDVALADFGWAEAYAREHPEMILYEEHLYGVVADTPALLALDYRMSNYQGGAHGDYGMGALIWDRRAGRRIAFGDLFENRAAAFAEVARLLCPRYNAERRRRFDGPPADRCPDSPYDEVALVAGRGGRIETLLLFIIQPDGYAGGSYTASLPVTPRLRSLLRPRYRDAFGRSSSAPSVCRNCRQTP